MDFHDVSNRMICILHTGSNFLDLQSTILQTNNWRNFWLSFVYFIAKEISY